MSQRESPTYQVSVGSTLSRLAALRSRSGAGLACSTSAPSQMSGIERRPSDATDSRASSGRLEVATAQGMPRSVSDSRICEAAGSALGVAVEHAKLVAGLDVDLDVVAGLQLTL